MIVPIVILAKERPKILAEMINSIEAVTDPNLYRIIICDNKSSDKNLLDYYKTIKHTVIYNDSNMLFRGFDPGLKLINEDYFILSDPDIRLNSNMPKDWPIKMIDCLKELNIPKIGLALNIDFKIKNEMTDKIRAFEASYWNRPYKVNSVPDECFIAPVDTTFAMYRRDTFSYWIDEKELSLNKGITVTKHLSQNHYNAKYNLLHNGDDTTKIIRIAGRFTCEHLGWDFENFREELRYYSTACDLKIASTSKWYKKHL